ncbi:UV radiation resistance-associated gene protein isoform X2 [Ceratitis capitata]|uniref:UV radiation resistance-associated gene protein isoform X2 n=1 Tax=Ceratitis capitata TaxID=7213 RepID=UPI000A1112B0|nr:UV radiation resistance-associated gene protein isoform X2 [Ceratitis capitata]
MLISTYEFTSKTSRIFIKSSKDQKPFGVERRFEQDEEAFYSSECLPHREEQRWAEIICSKLFKSNKRSVCVKVWARVCKEEIKMQATMECVESLRACYQDTSRAQEDMHSTTCSDDTVLFTWGVNFSGLKPLCEQRYLNFKENSLIFSLNGEYFTSSDHTISDISSNNSFTVPQLKAFPNETDCLLHRPSEYSCDEKLETVDILENIRYLQIFFKAGDVRKSYNLEQLLKLQEFQRMQLQKIKESKELTSEIKRRCLYCITKDQLSAPSSTALTKSFNRNPQRITMGRTLSELFSEQNGVSPHALLSAQKLEKQMETLRLKQRLIQSECDVYSARIAQQRNLLISLVKYRQQRHHWIQSRVQQLQAEKKILSEQCYEQSSLVQKKCDIIKDMERRMSALCIGLRGIYPIEKNSSGLNTINNVPFPIMDIFNSDVKHTSISSMDNMLPITLSVSLGYVAHLVQMIALIINRPLRNSIIHHGSRSHIIDVVKDIPYTCSEFPLYSRSTIPSKAVKYAIFLLNQNIAQLCYDIAGIRCDMCLTLENIHHIFTYLTDIRNVDEKKTVSFHLFSNKRVTLNCKNNKNVDNGSVNVDNNPLSSSHSSVEINNMSVPLIKASPQNSLLQLSIPLSIAEGGFSVKQRISRSVGSYSDTEDDSKNIRMHCYSSSDSNVAIPSNHL